MTVKTILACCAMLALGGCISVLPDPPPAPATYTMRVGPVEPARIAIKPQVISVAAPSMHRMASGADIVWRNGPELAVMEGVAWDDAAPELLQLMLTETLDRRGSFRAAVRSGSGARADLDIRWDALAFEVAEEGDLKAVLSANVRLIESRGRVVVASKRFEAQAPITSRSARLATAALESVAREVSVQIADWAAEKAPQPSPPPVVQDQAPEKSARQPSAASTRR